MRLIFLLPIALGCHPGQPPAGGRPNFGRPQVGQPHGTRQRQVGRNGVIELHDYENDHDMRWIVDSDCEAVHIQSVFFDTEAGYDQVNIGGQLYSGITEIDKILESSFTVLFTYDGSVTRSGFQLIWECNADIQMHQK
mgnify:CR=1 FL=1